jgi:hypothetical protein
MNAIMQPQIMYVTCNHTLWQEVDYNVQDTIVGVEDSNMSHKLFLKPTERGNYRKGAHVLSIQHKTRPLIDLWWIHLT